MTESSDISLDGLLHCPVCGRELVPAALMDDPGDGRGWECACGEFVPEKLAINSVEGCTHGRECNCSRSMRR